jgi:hypothetical protein
MGRKGRGCIGALPRIRESIFYRGFVMGWFSIKILTGNFGVEETPHEYASAEVFSLRNRKYNSYLPFCLSQIAYFYQKSEIYFR